jgi:glutathione S-transferase
MSLAIPRRFGLVVLVIIGHLFVNIYLGSQVYNQRKASGVAYPAAYFWGQKHSETGAPIPQDVGDKFNRYQRAHQNMVEPSSEVLALLICAGLSAPTVAAVAGAANLVGRIIYAVGYWEAAEKRVVGEMVFLPAVLVLVLCSLNTARVLLLGGGDKKRKEE